MKTKHGKNWIAVILVIMLISGLCTGIVSAGEEKTGAAEAADYQDYLWDLSGDLTDEDFAVLALRNYKFIQSLEPLLDADSFHDLYKANVHLKQNAEGSREEFIEAQNGIIMNGTVKDDVIFLWNKDNVPSPDGEEISDEELDAAPLDGVGFVPFLIKQLVTDPTQARGNIIAISGGAGSNRSNSGEAYPAAEIFNELGYNVFVLQYRVAPYSWEDMYMDTQRAVRLVRYYAQQEGWGGQDMIAAVGWSAGSMCIAGMINNLYGDLNPTVYDSAYEPDEIDSVNSDLDVAMLIYGGTIEADCANPHIPALYLCLGSEDAIFSVEEIQAMYDQAVEKGIPALFHVIEGVGHGFGVGGEKFPEECAAWPEEADAFMMENRGYASAVKVACIGDSITAAGYPEELGKLLGEEYQVTNYGQPGAQMMSGERFSYMDLDLFQESLDDQAEYYILMLGSNDSMSGDKWDPEHFREDYTAFLQSYKELGENTNIYVLICPSVYWEDNPRTLVYRIDEDLLNNEICPMIAEMAEEAGIPAIDLHSFTAGHPEWFGDGLHPNEEGNQAIAQYLYETIFS